jgi:colicin import membrane protein
MANSAKAQTTADVVLSVPAAQVALVAAVLQDKAEHSRRVAAEQRKRGNEATAKAADERANALDAIAAPVVKVAEETAAARAGQAKAEKAAAAAARAAEAKAIKAALRSGNSKVKELLREVAAAGLLQQ